MVKSIISAVKQYLLIDTTHLSTPNADIWKLSVLRIILAVGVTLTLAIVLHSSYTAYVQGLYYVLFLTFGFTLLLYCTLGLKKSQLKLASAMLILTIILAGLCILFFTIDLSSARYGLLFFFTLPVILRLLYGNKAAIVAMFINFIPFAILIRNQPLAPLFGVDITLPQTHSYLSSLVFLFFNFCIPLAVIRVMASLEKQSKINSEQSKKLSKLVNQYQEIFNNGGTPSFFCDQEGRILQANKTARKLIRSVSNPVEYIQQLFDLHEPLTPGIRQTSYITNNPNAVFEIQPSSLHHHKKQLIHCFDVSEMTAHSRKLNEFKRQYYENHYVDQLTSLKNHHYWNKNNIGKLVPHTHVALLKLASLREVNLQYGYAQGDKLLAHCANRLVAMLPGKAELFRFPGAKFLLTYNDANISTQDFVHWLKKQFPEQAPIHSDKGQISKPLTWYTGCMQLEKSTSAATVTESCAIALSQADNTNPIVCFDNNVIKMIRKGTQHKDKIKHLLETDNLALWLQPQVSLTNTIIGFEVLARLNDKEHNKILQPYQFLPDIEKNNWHILLTQKVLDKSIELIEQWPSSMPDAPLSINLSGPELLSDLFYEKLLRRFSESKLLRKNLKLELTETSVLGSHQETKRRLNSLAEIGVTIIIDDFGTGHASLSQLIDMSASVLKIDREFVERIEHSERHRKIVQMTLELAKSLNMQTIAEGVETQTQLKLLVEMGFSQFQGYLYGKPAPIDAWMGMKKAIMVGKAS